MILWQLENLLCIVLLVLFNLLLLVFLPGKICDNWSLGERAVNETLWVQLRGEMEFGSLHREADYSLLKRKERERETGPEVACQLDWDQNRHWNCHLGGLKRNLHKFRCPPVKREIRLNIKVKGGVIFKLDIYCWSLEDLLFFFKFSVSRWKASTWTVSLHFQHWFKVLCSPRLLSHIEVKLEQNIIHCRIYSFIWYIHTGE